MLKLNVEGIEVSLEIKDYKKSLSSYDGWSTFSYSLKSGDWLNFHVENEPILANCEIEDFEEFLTKVINGKILESREVTFIEPDFEFVLDVIDKTEDGEFYVLLDWKFYFYYNGITCNYLSISLDMSEIIKLRDYFRFVMNL